MENTYSLKEKKIECLAKYILIPLSLFIGIVGVVFESSSIEATGIIFLILFVSKALIIAIGVYAIISLALLILSFVAIVGTVFYTVLIIIKQGIQSMIQGI